MYSNNLTCPPMSHSSTAPNDPLPANNSPHFIKSHVVDPSPFLTTLTYSALLASVLPCLVMQYSPLCPLSSHTQFCHCLPLCATLRNSTPLFPFKSTTCKISTRHATPCKAKRTDATPYHTMPFKATQGHASTHIPHLTL